MLNKKIKLLTLTAAATLMLGTAMPANAGVDQKNVMFILDASNSMWGQIDGEPKIDIAKSVLKNLAAKMPADVKMGLISYGHLFDRKLNECGDMELMNPIGQFSAAQADNSFSFITPKGQTPIANTLMATASWLEGQKGQNNTVVLISDGLESCGGDVCAAAKALNDAGVTTKIHVVGFDLSREKRAKLQCIATNGNGMMFAANDAKSLSEVMIKVQKVVVKPVEPAPPVVVPTPTIAPPAPPVEAPAKPTLVFEDQFDGDDLADGWEVGTPNPDRYISEAGELLIIAGKPKQSPADEEPENLFLHSKAMPKGDWILEVGFKIEMQTGAEAFYFGVRNDNKNWLAGGIKAVAGYECQLFAFVKKAERGKITEFNKKISESPQVLDGGTVRWRQCGYSNKFSQLPFKLKLYKTGRSYRMSGQFGMETDDDYIMFETENLKMLRGKKDLFLTLGLQDDADYFEGEGTVFVDYVRVQKVAK